MTDMSWTANSSPLKGRDPKAESLLMEKIAILQKEFAEIDVDHNSLISKEELFSYLDRKSVTGKPFDRAIAQELFEHMDKNADGEITVNEFIKTYIEADEILRKKAETAKINKDYYQRQYEECVKKAEDAKATERYTAAGITQGSVVHVVVIEARPNRPAFGTPGNYYVEVSLDRQQITKTKVLSGIDPQWNEKFSFEVINPESQLRFVLYDQTRGADMDGDVNLPLGEISNQEIHDVWIDLYERNNQKSKAQIHVKLQWIHSKAKYYTIAAQKWQETIKKEEEELHEYERYIDSLHEPFEGLRNLSKSTKQSAAIEIKGITEIEGQFVAIMNKAVFAVAKEQNPGEGFWRNISRLGSLAEVVIALFICFARPDFFDIVIGLTAFLYIEIGLLKELISPRIIAGAVAVSAILLDLIWFFIYSGNWTDTQYKDGNLEVGTRRFSLILTFINILFKIVYAAVLYMYHLQIVKQRNSVPKVIMRDVPV